MTLPLFILFSPLLSAIINGFLYRKLQRAYIYTISALGVAIPALGSIILFIENGIYKKITHLVIAKWFFVGELSINWAIYIDELTAIMFLLINSVSFVVHIYSIGYMKNDKYLGKFLSFLSLFTFFMLFLVCADNFLQLFLGWESVGLCSYLLIGYDFYKKSSNKASIKAFIVNRIADFAFIIALIIIYIYFRSLDFQYIFNNVTEMQGSYIYFLSYKFYLLDVICLLLLIACMGKSAQIFMHVWLPDAMAGPTPVSALIHAATMVTAGVFLIVKSSYLFEYSEFVLYITSIVGSITCIFGALVAIFQNDIKKIIAYSTCSQLGYMFLACGASAYRAAIFHLVSHGFFKALLFLSAGNVIHACHEQDVLKMGGLRSSMNITYTNFVIASLSIMGIFPMSGFYSKDMILEHSFVANNNFAKISFIIGIIAAIFTAIYSMKIIILVFHGKTKMDPQKFNDISEVPKIMNLPLIMLLLGSSLFGMMSFYFLGIDKQSGYFLNSIFIKNDHHLKFDEIDIIIKSLPLISGIVGMIIGILLYKNNLNITLAKRFRVLSYIIENKMFFDELYQILIIKTVYIVSKLMHKIDKELIDRFGPGGIQCLTCYFSKLVSRIQTGYIFHYVFYIVFSILLFISLLILKYLAIIDF
ncbi:NADH-quinone oxidoreductase subunit L [Rickettsia endosymbiont of Cardiosporidium cionae]|uniref:NADH-quinone oxidoreductase subunit L n=1 Tax=Rickettsia endosymbiont of Cardiosporidium cionae TaxID=2777155 RepID=UPI0018935999|nr:NADH-quinone oxidoreductase subunit L [Rickettsia endosymbiont of Cardiosporidium cionae]KAF8818906.1 NADH-quinone oxidoreductase subunit L [Rickettsia endosymbiont of Cardiosporidium cionae]